MEKLKNVKKKYYEDIDEGSTVLCNECTGIMPANPNKNSKLLDKAKRPKL